VSLARQPPQVDADGRRVERAPRKAGSRRIIGSRAGNPVAKPPLLLMVLTAAAGTTPAAGIAAAAAADVGRARALMMTFCCPVAPTGLATGC